MKGQFERMKFDEFSLVILGAIIFIGILLIAFSTPSEFPPRVSPASVTLNLDPGSSEVFYINITSGISEANVSTSGSIASWLQPAKTDLGVLKAKEVLPIVVSVPESATAGTRTGKIIVSGKEGRAEVDVTIVVSAVKRLTSRTLGIGDFKILYLSGSSTIAEHADTFVSKSYLFEKSVNIVGVIEDDKLPILNGGFVRFIVGDTNNYGPIVVTQNGREIFSEPVGPGEVIVPLNLTNLRRSNTIKIAADVPGIFFWAENLYSIRDISVEVSYRGGIPKTYNFTLTPNEQRKFDHLQLTYTVRGSTTSLPPMKIELNGQTIFFEKPPTTFFNRNFARDVFDLRLNVAERNSLAFSFDQEASYEVSDATLAVFSRAG